MRHCQLGGGCRLPIMLLHFGLTLPDRVIGYRQKVLLEDCRSTTLLWHS
jgi:hypothetical protein